MQLSSKEQSTIKKLYSDLLHFYFSQNPIRELEFDEPPYHNFQKELLKAVSDHPFFCYDLYLSAIDWELQEFKSCPDEITDKHVTEIIDHIKQVFDINKQKHFIILPLQNSRIKCDYSFDNFHFLKKESRDQLIERLSTITGMNLEDVRDHMVHTEKSRSKDFLQSNLLVIEIEGQTEEIRQSAYSLGQLAVNLLLLLNDGLEYQGEAGSILFHGNASFLKENKHVAILSKDSWRLGHGFSWNAHLNCDIDLDFLQDTANQTLYSTLYQIFSSHNSDSLTQKFYNAFLVRAKARYQAFEQNDEALALLLYMVSLETLITEERNEKRLRLSAILPRLVTVTGYSNEELARKLHQLYLQRNNFMHAGKTPSSIQHNDSLTVLMTASAKLIISLANMDSIISQHNGESRLRAWNRHVDNTFDSIIFGAESTQAEV